MQPNPQKVYGKDQIRILNESDELLQSVLDNTSSRIILLKSIRNDRGEVVDFEHVFANKQALLSVGQESLIGKRYVEEYPFVIENGLFENYVEVVKTGQDWNGELYIGGGFDVWSHVYVKKWKDGCLVTYHDITEQKKAELELVDSRNNEFHLRQIEHRHSYLLNFAEAIKFISDPIAVQEIAAWTLGEELKANRVYYGEMDLIAEQMIIIRDYCRLPEEASVAGIHEFSTYPTILKIISTGDVYVEKDVIKSTLLSENEKKACLNYSIRAFVTIPLIKNNKLSSIFVISNAVPRQWTESEIELMEETADRTWSAVEQAKAEEALRNSQKKYHALFNAMEEGFSVCELILDEFDNPVDWKFLEMNPAVGKITGFSMEEIEQNLRTEIIGESGESTFKMFTDVVNTDKARKFEIFIRKFERWLGITAYHFEGNRFAMIFEDVTNRKRQEANVEFLAEISKDLVLVTNFDEMADKLGTKIGKFFNLTRCFFTQISDKQGFSRVSYEWHRDSLKDVRGDYIVRDFLNPDYDLSSHLGEVMVVNDTKTDKRVNYSKYDSLDIASFINLPLSRDGKWRFTTTMAVSVPRKWRDDEIELISELTERVWSRLERVRVEIALREREERYRTLFTSINEGFNLFQVITDENGKVVDCLILESNPASQRITRQTTNMVGRRLSEAYPDLEPEWMESCARAAIGREAFSIHRPSGLTGENRWYDVHFSPAGKPGEGRFTIVYTDITDRKKAEDDLRKAEEKYRYDLELQVEQRTAELMESREMVQSAFQASLVGFTLLQAVRDEKNAIVDFECVYANNVSIKQTGGRNMIGQRYSSFFPGDIRKAFNHYKHVVEHNEPQDFESHFEGNGFSKDFRIVAVKVGDGIMISSEDITEKKVSEEKIIEQSTLIKEQLHFINEVVSTLPDMLSVIEFETGKLLYVNKESYMMNGFEFDRFSKLSVEEKVAFIYPDDRPLLLFYFSSIEQSTEDEIQSVEFRAKTTRDAWEWFRARGKVFKRDSNGKAIQCVNIIQNIDRLKKSESTLNMTIEQLKSSEAHLKEAEKIGLMGSWEKSVDTGDLIWSDEMYRIFGFKPQSVKMTTEHYVNTVVHPDDREKLLNNLNTLYEKHIAKPCEYRVIANKVEKILISQPEIEKDQAGNILKFRGIVRDITTEKIAEKKLINLKLSQQKDTLRAIMLAQEQERDRIGEALHNGVSQTLYAIQIRLANMDIFEKETKTKLTEIGTIVKDAIDETRLISFELVPAVLKDFGLEVALKTLLHRLSGVNIKFNLSIHGLIKRLAEDIEFSVYRVVQELLNNVMKHSGATETSIEIKAVKKVLSITVADNGHGFNEKQSIPMHKGIGLHNVRNRVKLLDGTIKITSSEKGTMVKIKLPA